VKLLREMLDTMRADRDASREMAGKVTAALPAPSAPSRLRAVRGGSDWQGRYTPEPLASSGGFMRFWRLA
jgi:hypothetical protein